MAERAMNPIQRYGTGALVDMWTVPADIEATINMIACNQNSTRSRFSVVISPSGGTTSDENYLCRDTAVDDRRPFQIVTGITLRSGAVVRVSGVGFSFHLFRIERDTA